MRTLWGGGVPRLEELDLRILGGLWNGSLGIPVVVGSNSDIIGISQRYFDTGMTRGVRQSCDGCGVLLALKDGERHSCYLGVGGSNEVLEL